MSSMVEFAITTSICEKNEALDFSPLTYEEVKEFSCP